MQPPGARRSRITNSILRHARQAYLYLGFACRPAQARTRVPGSALRLPRNRHHFHDFNRIAGENTEVRVF
jgi:hypothetical protein